MTWMDVIAASVAEGPLHVEDAAGIGGVSARTVRRRAASEGWWRPYRDVLAVPGTVRTGAARARAATLQLRYAGPDRSHLVAATGATALALLGVGRAFPSRIEVAVTPDRRLAVDPTVRLLRTGLLHGGDVVARAGVPTVVGASLAAHLAADRDVGALRGALIDLRTAGLVDVEEVDALVARVRRFPGRGRLRQALAALAEVGRVDSPWEFDVRARFAAEGILFDRGQVRLPGRAGLHADLGIAALRVAVELDSYAHHRSRRDLERDARRANEVAVAGEDWRVVHVTWAMARDDWPGVVAQVRSVIASQAARLVSAR